MPNISKYNFILERKKPLHLLRVKTNGDVLPTMVKKYMLANYYK